MKTPQQEEFFRLQAQTTAYSPAFEVERAEGNYIYGKDGRAYLDFVAGVSACNVGHGHPHVVRAVQEQAARHMHVMVYGEYVQDVPLRLAQMLAERLPSPMETIYIVNSGTEGIEGALKLAKRYTGRREIVTAEGAYHGSTHGALSVMGNETYKRAYRPLLPGIKQIRFNEEADLETISCRTAAVILETIQGANGFIEPKNDYLKKVKARCEAVGALLILDEIQPGFGRTGKLFGFEHYGIVPDILVVGKAMGGGMPIGGFIASHEMMSVLKQNPKLGHITTFGGHPVCAAAAVAALEVLYEEKLIEQIERKTALFYKHLVHPAIREVSGKGLMIAVHLDTDELVQKVAQRCMDKGLIIFWLLYKNSAIRITPPLTITDEQIAWGCKVLVEALNELTGL
jgi:acetylornithine/succinyldiaminopimelate/putrescine aminotransferase